MYANVSALGISTNNVGSTPLTIVELLTVALDVTYFVPLMPTTLVTALNPIQCGQYQQGKFAVTGTLSNGNSAGVLTSYSTISSNNSAIAPVTSATQTTVGASPGGSVPLPPQSSAPG